MAVLVSACLGVVAVTKVTDLALTRLGLERWSVLLWFGLAEAPFDELAARRRSAELREQRRRRVLARAREEVLD